MNKFSHFLVTPVFLMLIASNVLAAETPEAAPVIRDGGMDAGAMILPVYCPSGRRPTLRIYHTNYQEFKTGQTCVYKADGSSICQNDWNIREAALVACQQ